jgi:hypothetical protein
MLPLAATALRDHLRSCVGGDSARVLIGHPALIEKQEPAAGISGLNLFFYRIEHAGYPAGAAKDEPVYLRLFCLITPVGSGADAHATGEADLRILGSVIDLLHCTPSLDVRENNEIVAILQIVPASLSVEDTNKIWSTQQGVSYRPSVAYEMSLVPTSSRKPPARALPPDLVVVGVSADMAFREVTTRKLVSFRIAQDDPAWVPHIIFAAADKTPALAATALLQKIRESEGHRIGEAEVSMIVAGKKGETVMVRYARWGEALGWEIGSVPGVVSIINDKIVVNEIHEPQMVAFTLAAQNQQLLIWVERNHQGRVLASNMLLLPVRLAK